MATTLETLYGTLITDVFASGLNSLAASASATSSAISNTTANAMEYHAQLSLAGTGAATAYVSVYVLRSIDGTNFETIGSASPVLVIPFTASPQQVDFSVARVSNDDVPFNAFKIAVTNMTGAALGASGNSCTLVPMNYQNV